MINSLDLKTLRNGEYSQLMQDVITLVLQNDPAAMGVQPQFDALVAVAGEIETLFKTPLGSAITAELENFDLLRDNAIKGILSIVRGNTYSEDPVIKNHATVLDNHLALFGKDIAGDSYQSETSSIRNITEDWNTKPELTAAITALGLDRWKTWLVAANNSFAEKYLARAVELGNDTTETLKAKRQQANEAYYKLRDNIDARYTITEGAEPYKTVVASLNGLITYYNELLARRGGGGGGAEIPPADTPPSA